MPLRLPRTALSLRWHKIRIRVESLAASSASHFHVLAWKTGDVDWQVNGGTLGTGPNRQAVNRLQCPSQVLSRQPRSLVAEPRLILRLVQRTTRTLRHTSTTQMTPLMSLTTKGSCSASRMSFERCPPAALLRLRQASTRHSEAADLSPFAPIKLLPVQPKTSSRAEMWYVGCSDGKLYGFNSGSGTALPNSPVTIGGNGSGLSGELWPTLRSSTRVNRSSFINLQRR